MENKRISVMRKTAAILALAIAANSAIYAGAEKPVFTDPDGITVQEEQKAVVSDLKEFLDAIAMGKKEITVTKMLGEVNNAALKNYPAFSDGVIDCNGCVIHISAPLFKAVNHGFTFKNATVTGSAEITAENEGNVGAVCLFNRGTISQVFVTADVKGGKNDYVSAGIVCGHNDGTVYQCLVKGSVKTDGGNHIGGVCGFNNGAVRECSASAEIICDSSNSGAVYGGICGMSNNKVSDCLFEGTFAGNPGSGKEVGGICGKFHGSDWAENCMYYDRSGVPVFTTMTNGTSSFDVYTLGNGAGSWYNGYKNNNNVNYGTVENIQDFTNGVILEKLADNRADVWVQGEKYPVLWFGYTPEPDEPEEPEVTTTEPETTTTSKVTTTEPAVTTTPKETTTEPETTTSSKVTTEPAVTTTTPKETTTEPETTTTSKVTTTEPAVTTTTPKETTTEPETTTSKVTTTEPAVTTTTPKVTTTPNVTTTEPEVTTTPAVTTPAVKKKLPPVTKTLTYDYGVSAEEIARDVFSKYGEIAAGFQKEFDIKTGSFELTMNDKTVQTGDIRQFISNIEKINKIGAVIFDDETFDIRTKADDIETVKNEVKKYFADAETAKRFIEQHRDDFTTADVIRLVQFLKNYDNNVIKTYAEFISSYQAKPGTYAVGTTYNYRNQAVAAEYNDGIIKVTVIIKEPAVTSPAVTTPEVTTSEETTSPAVTTGAKETTGPAVTTGAKETTGPAVTTGAKETTSPAVTTTGAKETTSPAVTTTGAKETTSPAVTTTEAKETTSPAVITTGAKETTSPAVTTTAAKETTSPAVTTTEAKETTGPAVTTGAKETSAPVVTTTAKVTETTAPVTSAGPANTTVTTAVSESISSSAVTTKLPEVTVTLASTSKLMESVTEKPVTEGTAVTSKTPANTTVPAASVTTARKTEVSSVTTAKVTEASAAVTTAGSAVTTAKVTEASAAVTTAGPAVTTAKVTEASAAVTTAGPANTTAVVTTAGPANTTAAVTTAATVNTTASVTTTDAEPAKTEATASAAETTTAAVTTAASETAKSEETSATLSTLPAFNIDVTDNKYNTEASASDVTETTEQPAASETTPAVTDAPAASETTTGAPVPAETAPASSETTSAEPAVKPSEEPAKPDDSDSKNDKPANDTPQSSGTPLDPIEIEVEKPSVLEGPAAFDTNVMLNASVGISLDDAMFFQGTKSFRYTVKLSGFNAENEYFDHAAFGFALPEGYSVDPDSVSTSLNGTVSFAAADSADAAAIRKKTNDTSNGGYVIFNNVDTKGLAEDAELFTVTIRVDETSDSYKEKISVVSLYGRYTEKSTSRTTAPGVALFIGSSENKTYNTDSSYALMGLRGDITLNHKVTQIDANAILIEVLHRDADCPSAIPEYIDIDRSLVDARVEKLAKFLGDVDESDHDKPDQIDATYILRAILIKDALGADIITEEIWQGLFNGEYNF